MPVKFPDKQHEYARIKNVKIPMHDGTKLNAYVYFPTKDGKPDLTRKYPVIMERSPYASIFALGDSLFPTFIDYYGTAHGYAVVMCSVRGTNGSEGILEPMMNEGWGEKQDGVDTVRWILQQPWCNGQVASAGCSYVGATQALIRFTEDIPGYETSCITIPALNSGYGNWPFEHGFFTYQLALVWAFMIMNDQLKFHYYPIEVEEAILKDNELLRDPLGHPERMDFGGWIRKYGLSDIPVARHIPFWKKWVENYDNPDFFDYNDVNRRNVPVSKPVMIYGGWYDLFEENTLHLYEKLVREAPSEEIAKKHCLIMGPTAHMDTPGARKFKNSRLDQESMELEWMDRQLKGTPSEFFDHAPVYVYVLGENKWRAEKTWPIEGAVPEKFYLHSSGEANSDLSDGVLTPAAPAEEKCDSYLSDPADPVPTKMEHYYFGGMTDHNSNEEREDVLVYSTDILTEDVEIGGYINAVLYASTNAEDTDFIVKLIDVEPDGTALNVVTGGVRGRYRKDRNKPEPLVPGRVERYEISMRASCIVFRRGHRIRIEVMSSDAFMWDPNPNRFVDLRTCTEKDYFVAEQKIWHDAEHPSFIELPVIPAERERDWIDELPFHPSKTGGYDAFEAQNFTDPLFRTIDLDSQILN